MKSHGLRHRSLYALAGLIAVGICAAAVALLWMDRRTTWNQAYVSARNLTEVLAADIGRTIRVYDLSLQGVIERLHEMCIRDRCNWSMMRPDTATTRRAGARRTRNFSSSR